MAVQPNQPAGTNQPNGAQTPKDNNTDAKVKDAAWLGVLGVVLTVVLVVILLAYKITNSSDIVAIIGVFTTLLGTLVGTIIGNGAGSQGKAAAQQDAKQANIKASNATTDARVLAGTVKTMVARQNKVRTLTVDPMQEDLKALNDLADQIIARYQ